MALVVVELDGGGGGDFIFSNSKLYAAAPPPPLVKQADIFFLVEMPFSRENQTAKSKLERFEDSMKLYFMFRWRTESDEIKVSLLFRRKMKINIVFNNFKNT